MKNKIIQFVKNHPFLYNLAKKFNRKLNRVPVRVDYVTRVIYYTYTMKNEDDLKKIREHYSKAKRLNTKPYVIIDNNELNKYIHKYISEKQLYKYSYKLEEIIKMTKGWMNSNG